MKPRRNRRAGNGRIEDVARLAGCSITTVSHYFSGKRPVSPHMGEAIQRAANIIGYRPDPIARAFATGRTAVLGVQFPMQSDLLLNNPYFPAMLESVSIAAVSINCSILTIPHSFENYEIDRKTLLERLDGALLIDPREDDPQLEKIMEHGLPIVSIGRHREHSELPWVDNDNADGIAQVFAHLDEQGYTRPMLMTMRLNYAYAFEIEAAYRQEMQRRGRQPVVVHVHDDLVEPAVYEQALRILDAPDRPDVIIASTDSLAVSVLRAALALGLRVPYDLGIIGEGDTILSRAAIIPISSVRINIEGLVRTAFHMMNELLNELPVGHPQLLPVKLIPRASSLRYTDT